MGVGGGFGLLMDVGEHRRDEREEANDKSHRSGPVGEDGNGLLCRLQSPNLVPHIVNVAARVRLDEPQTIHNRIKLLA